MYGATCDLLALAEGDGRGEEGADLARGLSGMCSLSTLGEEKRLTPSALEYVGERRLWYPVSFAGEEGAEESLITRLT